MARYDRTIPSGGEGKITLAVKTKAYQGKVHKSARVTTNDPKHATLTIGMKGTVWAPIRVAPRYAHLRGVVGDDVETAVSVEAQKKDPMTIELASVSIKDKVAVEVKELEKGKRYQIKVKNKVDKQGAYNGSIKLTTNYPEKPELSIRVSGNIRPVLEVRPKVLNFGRMSQDRIDQLKKDGRYGKRPVTILLNRGSGLKIEKIEVEKSLFKATSKYIQPGRMAQVLVEPVFEKLKKGMNEDRVKIYTNQKDKPVVEVKVQFNVL